MKKTALVLLYTILSLSVYSQKIIENPGFGFTTVFNLKIKSIELRDTATVISFRASYPGAGGYNITVPKETYIQPENGKKLFITAAEGITLNKTKVIPSSGETDYKLFFPKIDASVPKLDYGEEGANASWFIYDIVLSEVPRASVVPQELRANWFNKKTGSWELSFFDSTAVYKKRVWNYRKVNLTNGEGTLELKNNKNSVVLVVKKSTDGSYLIGEATRPLNTYVQTSDFGRPDEEGFQAPVFKNDSVNLSGYFIGYSPRLSQKSVTIYVDDILARGKSIAARLNDNGVFSVKLPLYYPHSVFINSVGSGGLQVFLEPGKDLFVLFDNPRNTKLYMGESGKINRDLDQLDKFNRPDFTAISKKMPELTPSQFKNECLVLMQKEQDALDEFMKTHSIGTKAYQVKKRAIQFRFAMYLLRYNALNSAGYYDFIKNDMINDPLAVISTYYSDFMAQLEMIKFISGEEMTYSAMMKALEDSGYSLTPEEKKLKEDLKIAENPEGKAAQESFYQKYGAKWSEFYIKYSDQFKELMPGIREGNVTKTMEIDYLIKKGVNFNEDEKALIEQVKVYDNLPVIVMMREVRKPKETFYSDHHEFLVSLIRRQYKITVDDNLGKLGIEKGLAMDIIKAQIDYYQIVNDLAPFSDEGLKTMRDQYKTPFIANYLVMCNKSTKEKIEANKKKGGSVVNEVPKIGKEKLFEELLKKYSGKVVLVDFWATWCAPCRAGIEQIKPLKEQMANEKVAFVYITDPTSPKLTYDRMIPDIKGEHYRLSQDEWQTLSTKFGITGGSGIPRYILVGKDGKVINPDLGHLDNTTLKTLLMKYIKE